MSEDIKSKRSQALVPRHATAPTPHHLTRFVLAQAAPRVLFVDLMGLRSLVNSVCASTRFVIYATINQRLHGGGRPLRNVIHPRVYVLVQGHTG
jgi:hypothetical protein